MTIAPGSTLAHYRITAALGAGGMGEVWRARDEKLGREVALKVLPEAFAQDPERLARFEREARVLASLNHPNIAHLYGLESVSGTETVSQTAAGAGTGSGSGSDSSPEPQASSLSSHPAAGTAAPQSGLASPDKLVGHASRVPGGVGGNSKLRIQNSELPAAAGRTTFLVMELVEGEDLSERLKRGPIPIDEAIPIARQIAEALESAHEAGIVHRDLKPANIKITENGTVKVLDFGLAKAWETDASDSSLSLSPTVTRHATLEGVILGTAAYMSPEQARGKKVDRRADIWAFGVVLWEMLTGRKLFEGETTSDVMAAVLTRAPDFDELPRGTPAGFRRLLERSLERDPRLRLQAMGEARIVLLSLPGEIDDVGSEQIVGRSSRSLPKWWPVVGLAVAMAAAGLGWWIASSSSGGAEPAPDWHFSPLTRLPGMEIQPNLSPDGSFLVYASEVDGDWDVFTLRLGGDNPINLTADHQGDDFAPVYSPDGRRIAFHSDRDGGGIFVMGATGESVRRVTDGGYNPSWSPDGRRLVFAREAVDFRPASRLSTSHLSIVDLETGVVTEIPGGHDAVQPAWSPDGEWIAFWGLPEGTGQRDIWLIRPDGSDLRPVTSDAPMDWSPAWSPDGSRLFFSSDRGGTLGPWWVEVDPESGLTSGEPQPMTVPSTWVGHMTLSADSRTMAFANADFRSNVYRVAFDRSGARVIGDPVPVTRGAANYAQIGISPDGEWVAAATGEAQETLTLIRRDGGVIRRLTDDAFNNRGPVWSPDGGKLLFYSDRSGSYQLHTIKPDGSSLEQLTELDGGAVLPFWSPDGDLVFAGSMRGEVMIIDLADERPIRDRRVLPMPEGVLGLQPAGWTEDGRGVIVAAQGYDMTASAIFVFELDAGSYRLVNDREVRMDFHSGLPAPAGDGANLLFSDAGRLMLMESESGRVRTLLEPIAGSKFVFPRVSPDGRELFFLRLEEEADLWVARSEPRSATD